MSKQLRIDVTGATVTSINPRSEKHGEDEKVLAVDVDLKFKAPVEVLGQIAMDDRDIPDWEGMLFDETGHPKPLGLKHLAFTQDFEDQEVELSYTAAGKTVSRRFTDVKAKKFKATPEPVRYVEFSLQLQMHPDAAHLNWLASTLVKDSVALKFLEPAQSDVFDQAEAAE